MITRIVVDVVDKLDIFEPLVSKRVLFSELMKEIFPIGYSAYLDLGNTTRSNTKHPFPLSLLYGGLSIYL